MVDSKEEMLFQEIIEEIPQNIQEEYVFDENTQHEEVAVGIPREMVAVFHILRNSNLYNPQNFAKFMGK